MIKPTILRLILAVIGAFLVTGGLLLRFYAAPALVAAPSGFSGTLTLSDPHGSYFDQKILKTRSNVPLEFTSVVRGDPGAGSDRIAVWDSYNSLEDAKHHVQVNQSFQRAAFDRRTAQLVDCCGASVNDDTRVRQYGVAGLYWPIGMQPKTYQVYDVATQRDWPARYTGTATVQGITTYVYQQTITPTVVEHLPNVPIKILGVAGVSYNVTAQRSYHAVNTYWIDPRTGVPVNIDEKIESTLSDPAGDASLTVAKADLKMSPSAQKFLGDLSKHSAMQLGVLEKTGPMFGLIGGGILLVLAFIPGRPPRLRPRRPARNRRDPDATTREPERAP